MSQPLEILRNLPAGLASFLLMLGGAFLIIVLQSIKSYIQSSQERFDQIEEKLLETISEKLEKLPSTIEFDKIADEYADKVRDDIRAIKDDIHQIIVVMNSYHENLIQIEHVLNRLVSVLESLPGTKRNRDVDEVLEQLKAILAETRGGD